MSSVMLHVQLHVHVLLLSSSHHVCTPTPLRRGLSYYVNLGRRQQTSMCWTFPERGQLSEIIACPRISTVYRRQSVIRHCVQTFEYAPLPLSVCVMVNICPLNNYYHYDYYYYYYYYY